MIKRKDLSTALFGIAVAVILWFTILSRETLVGTPIFYRPFHALNSFLKEIQRGRLSMNFLGNIILFMPIGFLAPTVAGWKKIWRTMVAGVGFSLIIETIQLITSRGCFDFDDVLLNGLGCIIGYGIHRTAQKLFTKNDLNASDI